MCDNNLSRVYAKGHVWRSMFKFCDFEDIMTGNNVDDDYRSSDDEDYNPETDEIDPNDELDDHADAELLEGDIVKNETKSDPQPTTSSEQSSDDVDALFAQLTGQDPLLIEMQRRKTKETTTTSTSTDSKSEEPAKKQTSSIEEIEKLTSIEKPAIVEPVKEKQPEPAKAPSKKRSGLLDAVQALSKRSKLSVLEKSDRDWKEFKMENKIAEDLESHNRGKNGYLNKLDFLSRTDNRQFENEKQMRAIARKDRL